MKQLTVFLLAIAALTIGATTTLRDELTYYLDRHNVQDEGYEMVASYALHGDTMLSRLPEEPLQLLNIGRWRGIMRRGTGMERDTTGRIIIGEYVADTLTNGVRLDSAAIYSGDFEGGMANGHGCMLTADGTYYEGQWTDNLRHGFGFSVAPETHIRVGQWNRDKYLGERMHYTSERIYGIDISRYQHGHGRKKYPILWNQLRIAYLGYKNQKNVAGTVDYPVSFVFIKSTESTNIRNPFYASDYQKARQNGIPIGAYHFFSCKVSGSAQAQFFLSNTLFRKGDLPPVLDLEPYPSQIAAMGGTQVMFRNVRAWLQAVEQRTGVKPILYVSQTFVNRYLQEAPDLKRDYQVWIARYGEYKPDVKLAVWQLSPNGRVTGIHGEVDINVFNGYHTQWEEFLQEMTIK
ncbi:MAG: glycosyl hydrolase family 25 [Prevotella sp.]|nr:glycosyl hydrolase family 25 [Prevotella sp.]